MQPNIAYVGKQMGGYTNPQVAFLAAEKLGLHPLAGIVATILDRDGWIDYLYALVTEKVQLTIPERSHLEWSYYDCLPEHIRLVERVLHRECLKTKHNHPKDLGIYFMWGSRTPEDAVWAARQTSCGDPLCGFGCKDGIHSEMYVVIPYQVNVTYGGWKWHPIREFECKPQYRDLVERALIANGLKA